MARFHASGSSAGSGDHSPSDDAPPDQEPSSARGEGSSDETSGQRRSPAPPPTPPEGLESEPAGRPGSGPNVARLWDDVAALWRDLRSRTLVHAVVVYLGASWVAIQVVHLLIERGFLPEWTFFALIGVLAVGFVVTILLTWAKERLVRARTTGASVEGWTARLAAPLSRFSLGPALTAVVAVAVAIVAGWQLVAGDADAGFAPSDGTAIEVLVLPFEAPDESGDRSIDESALRGQFVNSLEWFPQIRVRQENPPSEAGDGARPAGTPEQFLRTARESNLEYVTAGTLGGPPGDRTATLTVYDVESGEPVFQTGVGRASERPANAAGTLAVDVVLELAEREKLELGHRGRVARATSSPTARMEIFRGQDRFWKEDFGGAVEAFRKAIRADSAFALAYHRLSVGEAWRGNYPAALAAADSGLRRRGSLPPYLQLLLQGQRHLVRRDAGQAISQFQASVQDHPTNVDGWLGLGEAMLHLGGLRGHCVGDAESAFEHVVAIDSTFAPVYDHLVDLSLYRGDEGSARAYLDRMAGAADEPDRAARRAAVAIRFGNRDERRSTLDSLPYAERATLSELALIFGLGHYDLGMVDTVGRSLTRGPGRTPDDRLRGAQYRFAALAGMGRWQEAVEAWRSEAPRPDFDRWIAAAYLAGHPADDLSAPVFRAASHARSEGTTPDFGLPLWSEERQKYRALVHRATLEGDSGVVEGLLGDLETPRGAARDPTDPMPEALTSSLEARLALLAGDTTRAVELLERSVARGSYPYGAFFPLVTRGPQRMLLVDLALARGDDARAARWLNSFSNLSWSLGDVLYAPRVESSWEKIAPEFAHLRCGPLSLSDPQSWRDP